MPTYYMEVPVLMKLMVEVKADSKEAAKETMYEGHLEIEPKDISDRFNCIDYEWEAHEKVVQGNVYNGSINQIHIEEVEDDEDEDDE